MIPLIDFKRQYQVKEFRKDINQAISRVLESSNFILGPEIAKFEKKFSQFNQSRYTIALDSGTSALHLALLACGIGPGDEVITVPNTFVATIEAILYVGAKPVFVDIDPLTYNIDSQKIERVISKRTKAILPVHLYGLPAEMTSILRRAKKYNLLVIEDAAQAHGTIYRGRKVGNFGQAGCFSFYPTKVLGSYGQGGAVVTSNREIAKKVRMLRAHGSQKKYFHEFIGFNYSMSEIQAAVLSAKMKYFKKWLTLREEIARNYDNLLSNIPEITTPLALEGKSSKRSYYLYVIRALQRDKLKKYLEKSGIFCGIHYPLPLHLQKGYKFLGYQRGDFPEAEKAAREILSLPFYPELFSKEQELVAKKIRDFYGR